MSRNDEFFSATKIPDVQLLVTIGDSIRGQRRELDGFVRAIDDTQVERDLIYNTRSGQ